MLGEFKQKKELQEQNKELKKTNDELINKIDYV